MHLAQKMEVPYELGANRRGISGIVSHLTLQAVGQIVCVAVGSEGTHGNAAEKVADSVILCELKVLLVHGSLHLYFMNCSLLSAPNVMALCIIYVLTLFLNRRCSVSEIHETKLTQIRP